MTQEELDCPTTNWSGYPARTCHVIAGRAISKGQVGKAVIIGAGPIGLEMAEALSDLWGIQTTVVELRDQILPDLVSPTPADGPEERALPWS